MTTWPSPWTWSGCSRCCACGCREWSACDRQAALSTLAAPAAERHRDRAAPPHGGHLPQVQLRLSQLHDRLAEAPRALCARAARAAEHLGAAGKSAARCEPLRPAAAVPDDPGERDV